MSEHLYAATSSTDDISGADVAIILVVYAVVLLLFAVPAIVGLWKIFSKAGRTGWGAVVPFYNYWLIIEIVGRPGWWLVLLLIPYVNIVFLVILMIDLARSFGKSTGFGVGMGLLGFVFLPILGFSDATYRGPSVQPASPYLPPPPGPPPGWYPDPWNLAPQRWWDGVAWTAHTA
jgi:hypothetical protein